jgi:1-acyl-sn-glycerol-3-phosphate acyltransferase
VSPVSGGSLVENRQLSTAGLRPRAPGRLAGAALDWLATGASAAGVVAALVAHDALQRLAWLAGPRAQQEAARAMARSINAAIALTGARVSVRGRDHVDLSRNYIVVSNHQSMFDVSLLSEHLGPLHPRYVSKVELARGVPGVSYNLRRGGSALIERKDPEQARAAIAELARRVRDDGFTAVIFPEGTRSRTGVMRPFKPGGLRELVRGAPDVPVLPVTCYGGARLFSRNLRPLVRNVELGVVFHRPVRSPDAADDRAFAAFVADLERTIARALPVDPAGGAQRSPGLHSGSGTPAFT